ncbi:Tn3 family transposase [Micromonospora sp. NPDC047730]|uniref:Tn3 family transposase n=1 Tax=Micromonospora sp. NPDC047730 TaxID=3364253 RepID=UPI00371ECB5C
MPVEFLSDDQVAAYERFVGELSRSELEGFFLLDGTALDLIAHKRADHHKLGLGLQVGTVRFLGHFLTEDPLDVPWSAVEYVASQLEIADPSVVKRYTERQQTAYEHSWEIRAAYGYRDFGDAGVRESLEEFMGARAWIHAEGAVALFEQTRAWLRRERVLLPGVSVLARLVSSVREEAAQRAYRSLAQAAAGADVELPLRLRDLLEVREGKKVSELERLRTASRSDSGLAMSRALARVSEVLAIGAGAAQVQAVPVNRVAALARYGWAGKAPLLRGLAEPRKTATLLATARRLEAAAVDDALDLFDSLMATRLIGPARRATDRARLEAMPRLEKASATLMAVARTVLELLDGAEDLGQVWAAVERAAGPRTAVAGAVATVAELVPDPDAWEADNRQAIAARYRVVRPFVRLLAEQLPLGAAPAGTDLLIEVKGRLPGLLRRRVDQKPLTEADLNMALVPPMWRRAVLNNPTLDGAADRDAYVMCLLTGLHAALRRRDLFADPSLRWADPRAKLLDGVDWNAVRGEVLAGLGLTAPVEQHLAEYTATLDAGWRQLTQRIAEAGPDASVRVVPDGETGRMRLSVQRLEKLGDPPSLIDLRKRVAAMMPIVDLPELLMDVHSWTGMLDAYTHVGGLATRMDQLPVTVAALLVADACNVGLTPVIHPGISALTRDRLSHVDQNYIRADTHARLVDYQQCIGITELWGGGLVASVDGLRFRVPVQSIHAAPSPRFFGYKRGITWLNAVNDRFAGLGAIIITGTVRDSLYILDTLLNLDAGPKPEMVATDTASYSDIVFGLFRLLGYRFSPRIADVGGTGFWRADMPGRPAGDYGPLNAIARNKVNLDRIVTHWPDMLRVAGSLITNQVRAYDLLRMLTRDGHPTPLGQALAEYGRIAKTLHLLAMVDPVDETYRRTVTRQLNIGESRHSLARKILHGHRGDIMQPYRAGQEDQLGALGLVLNAVVLFNTRYIDLAVTALRAQDYPVRDEDAARLSPLGYAHINMLGRYTFPAPSSAQRLRPLRDPDTDVG